MNIAFIMGKPRGAFAVAVGEAEPGDQIVYHVGQHCGGPHREEARAAYEGGLVLLTSRRSVDGLFEYIAVRTKLKGAKP
jgi:uroporphyrinogen-III synthase